MFMDFSEDCNVPLVVDLHVVEESVVDGRTVTEAAALKVPLAGLSKDVGGRVPKDSLGLPTRVVEIHELERAVLLEGSGQIPKDSVNLGNDDLLRELSRNGLGEGEWSGLEGGTFSGRAIRQGDGDRGSRGLWKSLTEQVKSM